MQDQSPVDTFWAKVAQDEALQNRVKSIHSGEPEAFADELSELARLVGIAATGADFLRSRDLRQDSLDDRDLEQVVGGSVRFPVYTIGSDWGWRCS